MPPPEAKRQRVRKGTHSCWECKRRKMKCVYTSLSNNAPCKPCQHRGSKCVSQEVPEHVWMSEAQPGRRLPGVPAPRSTISETSGYLDFYQALEEHHSGATVIPTAQGKRENLSRFLHKSLPSHEDIDKICKASRQPSVLADEILTIPYAALHKAGLKTTGSLLEIPEPDRHPVLIARYMLQLATVLQHLHPSLHEEITTLSEAPSVTMERLTNLAINLVTTKDDLLGSIEGLECIMIESMYQANFGSLRRSWVANRRAMGIAQLMGLDRSGHRTQFEVLDPNTRCYPQLMWFRITPRWGRLERIHCVLSSKILERNASSISDPTPHNHLMTRTLGLELQKAARSLPSKWWLAPTPLDPASTDPQSLFWDTRRLVAQVIHYNLLNQLHLPYMLRSSSTGRQFQYEYSRITCVNASREILSRFLTLRSFNNRVAYSCRTVDFLALMAAMTLLLAHLDSHSQHAETENLLAHQYVSDRAMIEQAHENMQLQVETVDVSVQGSETDDDDDDDAVVTVDIPYFGIVWIASRGMGRRRPPNTFTTSPKI
ncbi:hypothetical protein BDW59DRAFT_169282 [Aspergillus cavernicola]|uniref:Zn(2)-C6 fungal-type domain-containing protein n=1 Tax=Aspergillus cavernicola TaxID=176166 RepID=A0ABR4IZR6_9EURO